MAENDKKKDEGSIAGWVFTRWYFWLIFFSYFVYDVIQMSKIYENLVFGGVMGSAIGIIVILTIPFFFGRLIYIKVKEKSKDD